MPYRVPIAPLHDDRKFRSLLAMRVARLSGPCGHGLAEKERKRPAITC